jgi:hypothetical protein
MLTKIYQLVVYFFILKAISKFAFSEENLNETIVENSLLLEIMKSKILDYFPDYQSKTPKIFLI